MIRETVRTRSDLVGRDDQVVHEVAHNKLLLLRLHLIFLSLMIRVRNVCAKKGLID
jgi:hypothetical protein